MCVALTSNVRCIRGHERSDLLFSSATGAGFFFRHLDGLISIAIMLQSCSTAIFCTYFVTRLWCTFLVLHISSATHVRYSCAWRTYALGISQLIRFSYIWACGLGKRRKCAFPPKRFPLPPKDGDYSGKKSLTIRAKRIT